MLVRPLTPRARVAATAPGESASFRAWSVVTRRGWGVKRRREAEEGTLKPTHESDGPVSYTHLTLPTILLV